MATAKMQKGTIVVADISGYTKFLTTSEVDHGHAIVKELLQTVRDSLQPQLRVIRTEGDALFGYIPDSEMVDSGHLLDLVEATYHAFADHMLQVKVASTCTCNACSNSTQLDLKLIAHHAEFIVEDLGGGKPDLSGPEVILAHRLLKNTFVEDKGIHAYFLVTEEVYERMHRPDGAVEHHESYEHFPEVTAWGFDLKSALERRRNEQRVLVRAEDCDFSTEAIVQASPSLTWAWLTEPAKMNLYSGGNQYSFVGGRSAGAEMHCAHGNSVSVTKIQDWLPFSHFTMRSGKNFLMPATDVSYQLKPLSDGRTRVIVACRALQKSLLLSALKPMYRKFFIKYVGGALDQMAEMIAEDEPVEGPPKKPEVADGAHRAV
jgi:class 3 adenylate cyclase